MQDSLNLIQMEHDDRYLLGSVVMQLMNK